MLSGVDDFGVLNQHEVERQNDDDMGLAVTAR